MRFPLLAEATYDPNTFDYCQSNNNKMPIAKDWIEVFRSSIPGFRKTAAKDTSVAADVRESKAQEFADRCAKESVRVLSESGHFSKKRHKPHGADVF